MNRAPSIYDTPDDPNRVGDEDHRPFRESFEIDPDAERDDFYNDKYSVRETI